MTSNLFHKVEDGVCILRSKGVFRQCEVYRRENILYAKHGTGYIILYKSGTSLPHVHLDFIDVPMATTHDVFGKLIVS